MAVGPVPHLVGARIRSQMQYRLSFFLDLIGACFISLLDFMAVVVLFSHLPRLAGWSLGQVAFFLWHRRYLICPRRSFRGASRPVSAMVRQGTFDLVLVRPVGAPVSGILFRPNLAPLGSGGAGACRTRLCTHNRCVPWDVGRVAMLCTMIPAGVLIFSAVWVTGATVTFWTVESREMANAFTYGGSFLAVYPVNIFGGWTRRMLAFVVPMAFVSYFPGLYILQPRPAARPVVPSLRAPLVGAALARSRRWVWQIWRAALPQHGS